MSLIEVCHISCACTAVLAGLLLFIARRRGRGRAQDGAVAKSAPEGKAGGKRQGKGGAGIIDSAKIQSTGGAESPMRTGAHTHPSLLPLPPLVHIVSAALLQ